MVSGKSLQLNARLYGCVEAFYRPEELFDLFSGRLKKASVATAARFYSTMYLEQSLVELEGLAGL